MFASRLFILSILVSFLSFSFGNYSIWPKPFSISYGSKQVYLSSKFVFEQTIESGINSKLLEMAFERYLTIIGPIADHTDNAIVVNSCKFTVSLVYVELVQELKSLSANVDESYSLDISDSGDCSITSPTVWGALHALETFSQLLVRDDPNLGSQSLYVSASSTPLSISDKPRFSHRGLLIDTSRHYLPVASIKKVVDGLSMGKFNVLHWHTVDAQSFPLNTPSAPKIVKGAYTSSLTYSMDQVADITQYAAERGIRIIFEVDVPGHAASWNAGYPELMANCMVKYSYNINDFALNPTLDETYDILLDVLSDIFKAASTVNVPQYMHLGGDEVVYGCWKNDSSITSYMEAKNIATYDELMAMFITRADDSMVSKLGTLPIHWEEVYTAVITNAKSKVATGTTFQVWTNASMIATITSDSFPVIASPSSYWYLDHLTANTWQVMYTYDPAVNLTSAQQAWLIGGEVAMWGESIDENNIEGVVFPRALAVGERLWSAATVNNQTEALPRLLDQRCRLVQRGIRSAPVQPSFCATTFV